MNLSKLNRVTHRDIGYLIAGLTIIYAISGIALNHKNDWNPNYIFDNRTFTTDIPFTRETFNDDLALRILKSIQADNEFKTFHFPSGNKVTIFINGGFAQVNALTGEGVIERISKRPLFFQLLRFSPSPPRCSHRCTVKPSSALPAPWLASLAP